MEDWKVAVAISLASNHTQVFQAITAGLLGINTSVNQLQTNFGRVGTAIGGAFALVTGGMILHGLEAIARKTEDLSHEFSQGLKLGIDKPAIESALSESRKVTDAVRGATQSQALSIFNSIRSYVRNNEEAESLMNPLTKFGVVSKNTQNKFGESSTEDIEKQVQNITKAADMMGWLTDKTTKDVNIDRFKEFLDTAAKVESATHGKIGAQAWMQMAQQGGPAMMNLSQEGLIQAAILAQETSPGRTGTSMMSLFQQFVGGTMTGPKAAELENIGLLKAGEYEIQKGGHVEVTSDAAKARLQGALSENPLKWFQDTVLPAMQSHGITDTQKQIEELFKILMRQTTIRLSADMVRNMPQMVREGQFALGAQGVDAALNTQNQYDLKQNFENLDIAWTNFLTALTGEKNELAISVLQKMTGVLESLTDAARAIGPENMQAIAKGIAILGASLVGAGVVAIVAALGPAGWLVLGIGALAAAAVAAGPFFESLPAKLHEFMASIPTEINAAFDRIRASILEAINSIFTAIKDAIIAQVNSITDAVNKKVNPSTNDIVKGLQEHQQAPSYNPFSGLFHKSAYMEGEDSDISTNTLLAMIGECLTQSLDVQKAIQSDIEGLTGFAGVGAGIINASLGGASGGYGGYPGGGIGHAGGPMNAGTVGGINVGKSDSPDLGSLVPPANATNAYIAATRARFGKELQDPNTRLEVAGMMLSEGRPLGDVESLMNRSDFTHKTLKQMLHSGFYGPINRGQLPSFMNRLQRDPKAMAKMNAAINAALAGSDVIHGATDQGMRIDPNGSWPGGRTIIGGEVFNDWGGGGGHEASRHWREKFEAGAAGAVHTKDADQGTEVHSELYLDGKVLARHMSKHLASHHMHPTQAPYHDGRRSYTTPDAQTVTT